MNPAQVTDSWGDSEATVSLRLVNDWCVVQIAYERVQFWPEFCTNIIPPMVGVAVATASVIIGVLLNIILPCTVTAQIATQVAPRASVDHLCGSKSRHILLIVFLLLLLTNQGRVALAAGMFYFLASAGALTSALTWEAPTMDNHINDPNDWEGGRVTMLSAGGVHFACGLILCIIAGKLRHGTASLR